MAITLVGTVIENMKTHHNQTFHYVVGKITVTPKTSMV